MQVTCSPLQEQSTATQIWGILTCLQLHIVPCCCWGSRTWEMLSRCISDSSPIYRAKQEKKMHPLEQMLKERSGKKRNGMEKHPDEQWPSSYHFPTTPLFLQWLRRKGLSGAYRASPWRGGEGRILKYKYIISCLMWGTNLDIFHFAPEVIENAEPPGKKSVCRLSGKYMLK